MPANNKLITTLQELLDHAGISDAINDIDVMLPDIVDVQKTYLKPILGKDFYAEAIEAYNEDNIGKDDIYLEFFSILQKAIANLALAQFSNLSNISFTAAGMKEIQDQTYVAAKQWRVDDLREYLFNKGFNAIDELLEFMEENIDEFLTWSESDSYTINKEFIVSDAKTFGKWHNIHNSRRIYLMLQPIMRTVEAFHIRGALAELYDVILGEIRDGSVSADIKEFLPYLQAAIVKFTIAKACDLNALQTTPYGFTTRTIRATNTNSIEASKANQAELGKLADASSKDGENMLALVIKHLNANATAEKYPEWFESTAYTAPPDGSAQVYYKPLAEDKIYMA